MFILPPPPKYYTSGAAHLPPLEALNTKTVLTEADDFSTPEGTYGAVDCIFLATPPAHPSDPAPLTINPLAPRSHLPSMYSRGPRLTVALSVHGNPISAVEYGAGGTNNSNLSTSQTIGSPLSTSTSSRFGWNIFKERRESTHSPSPFVQDKSFATMESTVNGSQSSFGSASGAADKSGDRGLNTVLSRSTHNNSSSSQAEMTSVFALANSLSALNIVMPSTKKGPKPKSNMSKSNSTFVSRSIVHENFNRRFNEKIPSDDVLVWANIGRSLPWLSFPADTASLASATKHEPLSKLLLTKSHPLCHDINLMTISHSNVELAIGTSAGDILWADMVSNKYNRINKNGEITQAAAIDIKWVPKSENFFVSAHVDGCIFIWDKEREDLNPNCGKDARQAQDMAMGQLPMAAEDFRVLMSFEATIASGNRQNPVASYRVCDGPISSMEFAPDGSRVCVTTNDGFLKIIDLSTETLLDVFPAYYGGMTCASFSPDGKYLACGGQDDTICIFHMASPNPSLVARLEGHTSWVSSVKFDLFNCDGENYRLGSTGEDGKLLLWDFNPRTLILSHVCPRTNSFAATNGNESSGSTIINAGNSGRKQAAYSQGLPIVHQFRSYYDTPMVRPIGTKLVKLLQAESEPLSDVIFLDRFIMVASKDSRIWSWRRP